MAQPLNQSFKKTKQTIKNAYLAGAPVPELAKQHGISDRGIYHHLEPLTGEEIGIHAQNASLKKVIKRKENHAKS